MTIESAFHRIEAAALQMQGLKELIGHRDDTDHREGCAASMESRITEQEISELVDRFYAKVRLDPEIGPIFNETVADWDVHLRLLKDFWSTVLLGTGRYKGSPPVAHFNLPIGDKHFERWLALFEETAGEVMRPLHAELVSERAHHIGENMKRVLSYR